MIDAARDITTDLAESNRKGCVQVAILARDVQKYTDAAEGYLSYVGTSPSSRSLHSHFLEKIPKLTDRVSETIRNYGIEKKNEIIWYYFAAILIFLLFFLLGYCCGSRLILRFTMIITFFLILGLLFMSVVLMIILVWFL